MKKIILCAASVFVIAACGRANAVTVMDAQCDQIAIGERGDVLVRCPVTEQLAGLQAATADSMFLSVPLDAADLADNEHIYVNVLSDADNYCDGGTEIRVLVRGFVPDWDNMPMYTVSHCVK